MDLKAKLVARATIINPFAAAILFNLRFVADDAIPEGIITERTFRYNPKFVAGLSDERMARFLLQLLSQEISEKCSEV